MLRWKRLVEKQVLGDGANLDVHFGRFLYVEILLHKIELEKENPQERRCLHGIHLKKKKSLNSFTKDIIKWIHL